MHFTAFIKCSPEMPHILLLDGHRSHKTICSWQRFRNDRISTTLHTLSQPLDECFPNSLKSACNLGSGNWMTSNPGKWISVFEVAASFATAYNKCSGVQRQSWLLSCGLWPYNPDRCTDNDFAATFLTEEPLSSNSKSESSTPMTTAATNLQHLQWHKSQQQPLCQTQLVPWQTQPVPRQQMTWCWSEQQQHQPQWQPLLLKSQQQTLLYSATRMWKTHVIALRLLNSELCCFICHQNHTQHTRKHNTESVTNTTSSPLKQVLLQKVSKAVLKPSRHGKAMRIWDFFQ